MRGQHGLQCKCAWNKEAPGNTRAECSLQRTVVCWLHGVAIEVRISEHFFLASFTYPAPTFAKGLGQLNEEQSMEEVLSKQQRSSVQVAPKHTVEFITCGARSTQLGVTQLYACGSATAVVVVA